jgi:NADH dehydrogenase
MAELKTKKHVLIVGGGFGGVKTALELAGDSRFAVTLISDRPDFWYFPSLYHAATGVTNKVAAIPLAKLFAGKRVHIVIATASKLDRTNKILQASDGQKFPYDAVVLALGVVTNYFGIPGLEQYSFGIKSIKEVEELKTHLHRQLLY